MSSLRNRVFGFIVSGIDCLILFNLKLLGSFNFMFSLAASICFFNLVVSPDGE